MNSDEQNICNFLYLNQPTEMINNQTKTSFVLQHKQLSTNDQKMIINFDLYCQCISFKNFLFIAIIIMPLVQTMVRCHNLTNAQTLIDGTINNNSNSDNFSENLNLIPVIQNNSSSLSSSSFLSSSKEPLSLPTKSSSLSSNSPIIKNDAINLMETSEKQSTKNLFERTNSTDSSSLYSSSSSSSISIVTLAPLNNSIDKMPAATLSLSTNNNGTLELSDNNAIQKSQQTEISLNGQEKSKQQSNSLTTKPALSRNNRHSRSRSNRNKHRTNIVDVPIKLDIHRTDPAKTCLIGDSCDDDNNFRGIGAGGYCYRPHEPINYEIDNDDTESFYEMLLENCPHFFNENEELSHPLCCTVEMEETMSKLTMSVDLIRRSCPACLTNVKKLFCNLFCSPNQRDFVRVDRVKGEMILEVTYAMSEMFVEKFFQSCQDVRVFGAYLMDFDSACGKLKRANCTPIDFLNKLGSLQELPFNFRPLILANEQNTSEKEKSDDYWPKSIMNDTAYRCNEAPPNQQMCRCEHCPQMCLLSQYNPHKGIYAKNKPSASNTQFTDSSNDIHARHQFHNQEQIRSARDNANYRINIRHVDELQKQSRGKYHFVKSSASWITFENDFHYYCYISGSVFINLFLLQLFPVLLFT